MDIFINGFMIILLIAIACFLFSIGYGIYGLLCFVHIPTFVAIPLTAFLTLYAIASFVVAIFNRIDKKDET